MFRPIRLVPDNTKLRFMRTARMGFYISMVACIASIALFFTMGMNYGIDFKGGTMIEIRTPQAANLKELRKTMGGLQLGDVELQEFGEPDDVLMRIEAQPDAASQQAAIDRIKAALGSDIEYRRIEVVGPKVSGELAMDGLKAVLVSLVAVLIYIWFRFEWMFAIGAIASLLHDVILTIGLFAILRIEFNLQIIAAILTIVGYSLNDTVVVFDRVRENLRRYKQPNLSDLIDLSLNEMLPRTMMTSLSTLLALFSLYFFGGEVIRGFTFTMIWGVLIGTYSSIYIAAPVLIFLNADIQRSAAKDDKKPTRKEIQPS